MRWSITGRHNVWVGTCGRPERPPKDPHHTLDPWTAGLAHSPGNLLLKELAAIAFAQCKMFDLRITPESYKLRWADTEIVFRNYACATRLKGLLPVAQQEIHTRKVALRKRARRARDALRKHA